jgi:homocysteine S-methyltransferase
VAAIEPALRALRAQWAGPLGAYPALPDEGSRDRHGWRACRDMQEQFAADLGAAVTPRRLAQLARGWIDNGASIVGGCCGTTPRHIAALRAELGSD